MSATFLEWRLRDWFLIVGWFLFLGGGSGFAWAQKGANPPTAQLDSPTAQASYGVGRQIANDLMQSGLSGELLDLDALILGLRDAVANQEPRVTQQQFQAAMLQVQQAAQEQLTKKMQIVGEKNRREGPKFLEKYKAFQGVQELPSGLLYKVIKSGTGPSPKLTDIVKTHYRGRLVDGTEFDSTYQREQPAVFAVNQVIDGWSEALQKMKVGDHYQLVIPPELAYGEQGNPPLIGPHAVLIFDLELLGIVPPQEAASEAPVQEEALPK
jgi:FKBP-type peptidyl-prolyl cis-trans isomerase